MKSVAIENRFCGPPNSANGGYVCGLLAAHIHGDAETTLRAPPPLGQRLAIVASEHGVELRKDETTLATGRIVHIDVAEIPIVNFSEAEDAVRRTPYDESNHKLPMCFIPLFSDWAFLVPVVVSPATRPMATSSPRFGFGRLGHAAEWRGDCAGVGVQPLGQFRSFTCRRSAAVVNHF